MFTTRMDSTVPAYTIRSWSLETVLHWKLCPSPGIRFVWLVVICHQLEFSLRSLFFRIFTRTPFWRVVGLVASIRRWLRARLWTRRRWLAQGLGSDRFSRRRHLEASIFHRTRVAVAGRLHDSRQPLVRRRPAFGQPDAATECVRRVALSRPQPDGHLAIQLSRELRVAAHTRETQVRSLIPTYNASSLLCIFHILSILPVSLLIIPITD